jgi:putative spermidine/putrescine transport system ATP-binding protein
MSVHPQSTRSSGLAVESLAASVAVDGVGSVAAVLPAVEATAVTRRYGEGDAAVDALRDVSLTAPAGEVVGIMGPSGSGKSSLLHILAGLDQPTSGHVSIGGKALAGLRDRELTVLRRTQMGFVFQFFNLLPMLTAEANIVLPLKLAGEGWDPAWVDELIDKVGLSERRDHRPSQLSGGQQQRVALARAIVIAPRLLLCDEPLAALDRKLRQSMQFELKGLQQKLGVTTIFVTHDQEEAMTISDRIAVMNAGRIEQIGTPREIYDRPRTRFVSDFIGEINLFTAEWYDNTGKALPAPPKTADSGKTTIAIRPERMRLTLDFATPLKGRIQTSTFVSGQMIYRVVLEDGRELTVKEAGIGVPRAVGAPVGIDWDADDVVILNE